MKAIHHINLAAIDLNLLVVFDALMAERHVTRAAARLGLSQPATSNALSRLRSLFDDELLIRTSAGMQPTPKAMMLIEQIQPVLVQIQGALHQSTEFDPATSDRTFTIGTNDYGEFILLPQLMKTLQAIAPQIRIKLRAVERQHLFQSIDNDVIDVALGLISDCPSWHVKQVLLHETFVGVARRDHPHLKQAVTLADYLSASHLLVSPNQADMVGWIDQVLEQQHLKRHVAIAVPHFLVAPFILEQTDLIATLAERVAQTYTRVLNLRLFPLPFAGGGFDLSLLWHSKNTQDPAHQWLRQMIMTTLVETT